ncbi:DUF5713 family protein [Streptomyces sp. NPDC001515]
MPVTNEQLAQHAFLAALYDDDYFPNHLLDKGRAILVRLCERIEAERPAGLPELYALSAEATEEFNELDEELQEADSEIETVARDEIAGDFGRIAQAYGFVDADVEEMIATRDW